MTKYYIKQSFSKCFHILLRITYRPDLSEITTSTAEKVTIYLINAEIKSFQNQKQN